MPISSGARSSLEAAAKLLLESGPLFGVDSVSPDEVATNVADVVRLVMETERSEDQALAEPPTPLQRKILAQLRRKVIERSGEQSTEMSMELLSAIEATAASLEAAWSERFQDRLTGPSGLDLVVEVAHDLRSPLTSILFLAETMLRGRSGPLTPLQERQLGLVYSAAFGLNAVASDVIELVRGGDRLVDREAQPFSVAELLESVRDIVLPIAEEKGLSLSLVGPDHDHRIGHPGALNRVLLNLTTNALKFTATGGVTVELTESKDPTMVKCTVRDSGRGIPEAAIGTLFEPFRRRQQAGDYAFSGSGLGLSICRKLVEAMGSELQVETSQGEGTAFYFNLTLSLLADQPDQEDTSTGMDLGR